MLSQLGYVCLFSSAFPLAAFAALLGNLLELRGDAFKLCFVLQRPFGRRVSNIGTWQNAMEAMGFVAILVNCTLIGLSGQVQRMFPEMSTTQTILLIVALEHIMLAIRFIIICAIPDIPTWVATEMAKVEFLRRDAVRRLSSTPSPSEYQPTTVIGRFVVSPADGASNGEENLKQKQQYCAAEIVSARSSSHGLSQPSTPTVPSSSNQTPSRPGTPSSVAGHHGPLIIPKIAETPILTPETPNSTGSGSDNSSAFLPDGAMGSSKELNSLSRGSIPGRETGQRSRDWIMTEQDSSGSTDYSHHLTIGPHGGIDWVRRLGLEGGGRKSSDSEISGAGSNSGDEMSLHRSTDCIPSKDITASSDSDLLRSIPPWSPTARNKKFRVSPEKEKVREKFDKHQYQQQLQQMQQYQLHRDSVQEHHERQFNLSEKEKERNLLSDLNKTASSQEDDKSLKEDREAKKTRVKQSLMKRARSVAIFSLKLKERRAREAEVKAKEAEREARWQQPQSSVGGELSCIPIEKLISVDDIATMEIRRINH